MRYSKLIFRPQFVFRLKKIFSYIDGFQKRFNKLKSVRISKWHHIKHELSYKVSFVRKNGFLSVISSELFK